MNSKVLAAFNSVVILVGYASYNQSILFGKAKPSMAAWLLFGFLVLLNVKTYYEGSKKSLIKTALPAASGLACIITTIVVIFKGGNFGKLDGLQWVILAFGIVASIVWFAFQKAEFANLIVIAAVAISFIPIYVGMYRGTVHETPLPWFIWSLAFTLGIAVVKLNWSEEPEKKKKYDIFYPVAMLALHLPVALFAL